MYVNKLHLILNGFVFCFADYMQSLCKNHFLQQLYRKIDGAVLWSQNERNLDCVITFQTHSILQRFMLRFDMLQLDCNDHLFVYDGAHAVGTHKVCIIFLLLQFQIRNPFSDKGHIFHANSSLSYVFLVVFPKSIWQSLIRPVLIRVYIQPL